MVALSELSDMAALMSVRARVLSKIGFPDRVIALGLGIRSSTVEKLSGNVYESGEVDDEGKAQFKEIVAECQGDKSKKKLYESMVQLKMPFSNKKEDYVDAVLMLSLGSGDTIYDDVDLMRSIEPRVVAGESDKQIKESLGHTWIDQAHTLELIDNLLSMATYQK